MPRTATRQCSPHNTVVSPVFLNLNGGTDQRDGQMGLVLLREAMQTNVLLHLIIALAAFKPNQLHASLDFFSELHKEPFILQQRRKPLHAPSGSSQFQQFPSESYPKSQVTAQLCSQAPCSPGVSSSSSCSKPCLLPACHVLEYLISLLRAPVWQWYRQGEPACCLFLARQSTEQDTCL